MGVSDSYGAYTGAALIDDVTNDALRLKHMKSAEACPSECIDLDTTDYVAEKLCEEQSNDAVKNMSAWAQFVTDVEKLLSSFVAAHRICLKRVLWRLTVQIPSYHVLMYITSHACRKQLTPQTAYFAT